MIPRPFQRSAVDRVLASLRAGRRPILVSPTGSGKSYMGSMIVHEFNAPTLWIAHRRELVDQGREELSGLGIDSGVVMSGRPCYANRQILVASDKTAVRRSIHGRELLVFDECHHAAAGTFRKIREQHPHSAVVGLSATPFRLDLKGLGDMFDELIVAAYADELVDAGFLVEPKVFAPRPSELNLPTPDDGEPRSFAGMARPKLVGDAVATWRQHAAGMRTIVFASSVEHSISLAAQFRSSGVPAEHIDADTDDVDRRRALDRFKAGGTTVLCNVELFTEGFNLPAVECVQMMRSTASLGLFLQMVGRAMRIHPGKRHPVVLDHSGNFLRHGRVTRRLDYSLEGRPKFTDSGPSGRTCHVCFCLSFASAASCPECGTAYITQSRPRGLPEQVAGTLQMYSSDQLDAFGRPAAAVEADRPIERRKVNDRKWFQLLAVAKQQKFSHAWVSSQYQKQTGERRTVREVATAIVQPSLFTEEVA